MKKNRNQFKTLLAACDAAMARGFTHILHKNETLCYFYSPKNGCVYCTFADKYWTCIFTDNNVAIGASAFTQTIEDWKADVLKPIKLDLDDL
jgi:hypothetical protein